MRRSNRGVLVVVASLAALVSMPALGDELVPIAPVAVDGTVWDAASNPGCQSEDGLAAQGLEQDPESLMCLAEHAEEATVDSDLFQAKPQRRRTCRCSCGYPCQTNADCGPGGICSAGVTCC